MKQIPENITLCELEVIILPNGEILCNGKSMGFFKDFKKYLTEKKHETIHS